MKTYFGHTFAALVLMAMHAGNLPAQDVSKPDAAKVDEAKTEQPEPLKVAKPTRAELRDKQLDVSLEARDIERILGKLKKASELSKTRITEAAKVAESASTSLDKGDSKTARAEAQQTAEMFQEIAKQLEALLKEEAPQQIAEARELAKQLAKAEREFAERFQGALNPTQATSGKGKVDPKSQVKPLTDPDMKMEGNQGKSQKGNGGKNGNQNPVDQNSEKKDADGKQPNDKNGDKPEPNKGDADQPGDKGTKPRTDGKNGGDKPMPDGQGGASEDKEKDKGSGKDEGPDGNAGDKDKDDKKPGADGKSEDEKDGDKDGKKKGDGGSGKDEPSDKPGAGAGQKKEEGKDGDEKQPGGGGSKKEDKDKQKPGDDQDGSGGDKPNDKKRDGSGGGSDDERMNDKGRNGRGKTLTAEQLREMAAARADQLAERGKTLQDVLNAIAQSTDPNDKDAVAKIQAISKEIDVNKLVAEMSAVSNMIRSKKDDDAKLSSLDAAERLEIMAQRLDGAYRGIVAPQAEELRKLEQALADLRDQMENLETPSQVAAWHREARELLDKLDKLGVNLKAREELELEMKKAGFGIADRVRRDVTWGLIDGRYDTPAGYNTAIIHLQEDVQERIQALILGDLGNVSDEATPPKYQELVEKYYEVLSRNGKPGAGGKPEARNPTPNVKAKSK